MKAAPLHCPYCGEQDLRPDAADGTALPHGCWRCAGCRATFRLSSLTDRPAREVTR